jgi:cation:H+ antiporter
LAGFSGTDKLQTGLLLLTFAPFAATIFLGYGRGDSAIVAAATGLAIASAGFALAWGTESLQFVVSQVMALAILAVVQVIPEYSVEVVLAYRGASNLTILQYATAAMTGANRLLLGLGWPVVFVLSYLASKRNGGPISELELEPQQSIEVFFLGLATLYSFVVVARGTLGVGDAAVLLSVFAAYLFIAKRMPPQGEERMGELEGPARAVASLRGARKALASAFFVAIGGIVIAFGSEPFVNSFLTVAASLNLNQYLLIQWLTPVLTELPEAVTVFYWAARTGKGALALANLISSKLNQWTVLVSTIPVVYAVALGGLQGIPLTQLQTNELLLTASQSLFGFACLIDLRLSWREALILLTLFSVQFLIPPVRVEVSALYVILAAVELFLNRNRMAVPGRVLSLVKEHIH